MSRMYSDFKSAVYEQALGEGYSEEESRRMSALAVISRFDRQEQGLVAESNKFKSPDTLVSLTFNPKQFTVSESDDGGLEFTGSLSTQGLTVAEAGRAWNWTKEALQSMADKINSNGIAGVFDNHKEMRSRANGKNDFSVVDRVKAWVEDGQLWINGKIRKGFEWVLSKYKGMSIEAKINPDKFQFGKILDAEPFAFTFTNVPRRAENRVVSVG